MVNLIPESWQMQHRRHCRMRYWSIGLGCEALILVLLGVVASGRSAQVVYLDARIPQIEQQSQADRTAVVRTIGACGDLRSRLEAVKQQVDPHNWVAILQAIADACPSNTVLYQVSVGKNLPEARKAFAPDTPGSLMGVGSGLEENMSPRVVIHGMAADYRAVVEYVAALRESGRFEQITLRDVQQRMQTGNSPVDFGVVAVVRE